jgi:HK97 family phage portal protein
MKILGTNYSLSLKRNTQKTRTAPTTGGWESFGDVKSNAGVTVSKQNAMKIAGVYSAVRIITDSLSLLPTSLFKQSGDNKIKDVSHALGKLLGNTPNSLMTWYVFWQIIIPRVLLWGNGYAIIEYEGKGSRRPKSILPVPSDNVEVNVIDGVLIYTIKIEGQQDLILDQTSVLHFRGLGNDIKGKSVIDYASENLGLGKAAEEFGAKFFGNGANMNGVLTTDQVLGDKARENLRTSWHGSNGGMTNAQKTSVLEQGLKYQSITIPPDQAQFLATREFSITDIARWFSVPPHKIADLNVATISNIEQQDLNFVKQAILPYCVNIEQELNRKLLRESEKGTYFFKKNLDALLRADIKTRYEVYKTGIQNAILSPNEVRALEELNPYDGGDSHWMQTNTAPIDENGTNQNNDNTKNNGKEDK